MTGVRSIRSNAAYTIMMDRCLRLQGQDFSSQSDLISALAEMLRRSCGSNVDDLVRRYGQYLTQCFSGAEPDDWTLIARLISPQAFDKIPLTQLRDVTDLAYWKCVEQLRVR